MSVFFLLSKLLSTDLPHVGLLVVDGITLKHCCWPFVLHYHFDCDPYDSKVDEGAGIADGGVEEAFNIASEIPDSKSQFFIESTCNFHEMISVSKQPNGSETAFFTLLAPTNWTILLIPIYTPTPSVAFTTLHLSQSSPLCCCLSHIFPLTDYKCLLPWVEINPKQNFIGNITIS